MAQKFNDNILQVMIMRVIVQQPATPSNPAANPLHALLKAPNTLIIKHVHFLSGKFKATRLHPKLAESRAQKQCQPHLPIRVIPW